jgi:WD40 repeat protein
MPVKIFFCYAREDELLLNKLKTHLQPLQREGLIEVWYDRDISAGTEWETEIKERLNAAQIVLLLVSPDSMDSDYCYSIEMKRALERRVRGEAEVIPVILRPVYWHGEPLGKLQALPKDGKPVTDPDWYNLDRAFYDVATGIRKVLKLLLFKNLALLRTLTGHTKGVCSVAISPDGQSLVSGGHDNMIKVQNLTSGEKVLTFTSHKEGVRSVAISPNGQMLVSGSNDHTIKIWGA